MSVILEYKNVNKNFGDKKVLNNVDLKIESNKIVGLLGKNGSGKSTLFKLANDLLTPTSGEGQVIYGITLGIISSILRFIIPELSIVISLILGPIVLTKIINHLSFKLRYNQKFYATSILSLLGVIIITLVLINIII